MWAAYIWKKLGISEDAHNGTGSRRWPCPGQVSKMHAGLVGYELRKT